MHALGLIRRHDFLLEFYVFAIFVLKKFHA